MKETDRQKEKTMGEKGQRGERDIEREKDRVE
jgi:hypothetical protein